MDKILKALQWAWLNKEEIMATATSGMNFAVFAGSVVTSLLNKTPDGDPSQVTDQMVEDLKKNWRGVLPPSSEMGFPPAEDEDDGLDE